MISAVVPAFNEEESLEEFYKVLIPNLAKLDKSYEAIFVDDGSSDNTLKILQEFEGKNKNVKILSFRQHRGKAEALTSGFQAAKGDLIVTLDADLQDRPEEIENLVIKQKEGLTKMLKELFPGKLAYELIPTSSPVIAEIDSYIREL